MDAHHPPANAVNEFRNKYKGQVVLVMQGGGALGAYQCGVYEALHEAGVEPDWVIGTSIGAINAGIICGNEVENRVPRLKEFWRRVERAASPWAGIPFWGDVAERFSAWSTFIHGIPGFYENSVAAFRDAETAGCYSTTPLRNTLNELVDLNVLNRAKPRLKVGAAQLRTSVMRYFDSRDMPITIDHIMASGALPPAFPPVRIDGELYWDGGILSNTPTEVVLDDNPRKDSLIFTVHLWNPVGDEPNTMAEVLNRQKDVQYSSRIASQITRHQQTHRLRHVINELAARLPESERDRPEMKELMSYGCQTRMHVVQLLAPQLSRENHTKDVDFSPTGIRQRWDAGYAHTRAVLAREPWGGQFDPLSGVILHETKEYEALVR